MFYRKRIEKLENELLDFISKFDNRSSRLDQKIADTIADTYGRLNDIHMELNRSIDILRDRIKSFEQDNERITKTVRDMESNLEKFSEKMNAGDASAYKNMIEQFLGTIKNMNEKYSDAMHSLISESSRITTFAMDVMDKKSDNSDPIGDVSDDKDHLGSRKFGFNIIINGVTKYVKNDEWDYSNIIFLAFGIYPDIESEYLQYIITYGDSGDPERRSGNLAKHESIPVREGTYFTVVEV